MERLLWLNDFVILFLVCTHVTMVSGLPPDVNIPRYITVKENVSIGSVIGSFTAIDQEGSRHIDVETGSISIIRIEESNTTTGNWSIILNTTLDRETTSSYVLSFTADTKGPFPLSVISNMFVQDVNDVHPRFENLPYNIDLEEDTRPGQIVYTNISASDPDDGIGGRVNYYMQDVTQRSAVSSDARFSIDKNSGNISFDGQLDYETIKFYHYKVTAVDGGNLSSTTDLFITVTDVQDTEPYFSGLPYMFWLTENTPSGTPVYKVNAFDGDTGIPNNVTYSFVSADPVNCSSFFGIDSATGEITVTSNSLDRDRSPFLEQNGVCEIVVQAEEISTGPRLNDKANCTLTLTVNDVNDNIPTFSNNRFTATITENSGPGTPLTFQSGIQISVSDADQGVNSDFSLGLSNACLSITPTDVRGSANIILLVSNSSCFDFEVLETMTFRITATSNDGSTTYADVDLQVINTNDNAPVIQEQLMFPSIPENSSTSTTVAKIQASDADKPPYNNITFSLQGGDDMFVIDEHTGVVTVNKKGFDYETRTSYTLIVEATDGGGLRDSATLIVNITDVNDNEPVFKRLEYQAYVTENTTRFDRGASLKVEATDEDEKYFLSSHSSNIRYSFVPTLWSSNFSINETTGEITLTTELDYERTGASFVLTVQAADRGSPEKFGFVNVTINVQDKNDFDPRFDQNAYSGNVSENAGNGITVVTLHATDEDGSAPNNDIFYLISSGSNDQFAIDSISGSITTVGALDRETMPRYVLVVLAVDRGSPALTATATVSIEVDNINDFNPVFDPSTVSVSVDEEQSAGFIVSNFSATDKDSDANLEYSINWSGSKGLDENQLSINTLVLQDAFSINPASGQITVNRRIDRETLEMATLLIKVLDKASYGANQTASGTVSIQIKDIDDNPPHFSVNTQINANISENSPRGTPLQFTTDITVTDIDKDTNSDFSLNISNYTSCLEVTPVKARREATVLIRVSDPKCFDYEIRQTLEFQIIAIESTTRTSSSVNITLMILNENDNDPTFNQTSYSGSVLETVKDLSILQVYATDNDTGVFGSISYSLEGDRDRFTINNKTGEITTKDDNLDRETKDTYLLTVVATDSGGRRSGVPLAITITDANDETPAFLYSYVSRITEGSQQLAPNMTLQAKDNDQQGSQNSHVIYRIADCNPNVCSNFTLDGNSGLLTVNSTLDYEKLLDVKGVIIITVWAIDNGTPQLTGNTTVQITVEDLNDVQPVFSSPTYTASVPENAPSGTSVGHVNASDSDGSAPNNDVFYIISSGSNDQFIIDGNSGNITTVGTLDRERVASYTLVVLAIDRGSPAMTASTTVHIEVLNVNDDPPRFEPPVASVSVNEEINRGSLVYNFIAHDGDSDAALLYSILWQNSSGLNESQSIVSEVILQSSFKIDSSTGLINVNERLDRETVESAVLVVMVVDTNAAANTIQTATGTVSVRVNDVNDHVPVFSPNGTVTANVPENSPTGTPLQLNKDITILDVDKDANSDFSLTISNYTSCLEVTPVKARREASVLIRVSDPTCFDYEITQTLEFQIIATESTTGNSSNVNVTLTILNENDNDPTFNQASYNGSVPENANGRLILQVHATDNDVGIFGSISYSLEGDRDRFTINNKTGEITTKDGNLDREKKDTYLLTVVATDSGGRRSGVPLSITVTDANDETPVFLYSYASRIAEDSLHFAPNLTLQANDNDQEGSENSHVIYRIATCNPNVCSNFTLDENSGLLTVNSPLDYEKLLDVKGVITITVNAIDNGTSQLTGNTTVQITVEDINDVQPVFSSSTYTASVPENAPSGTIVQQVHASDSDGSAPNNDVFYIISSGSNDQFVIDGNSGNITTVGTLDRERVASYVLIVLAIDRGSPAMTANTTVSIEVLNVNDDLPRFEPPVASVSVDEEINPGSLVYNFSAHDGDSDAALLYTILWQNSSGLNESQNIVSEFLLQSSFKIDNSTGLISVNERLDRETLESAVLVIMVVDTNAAANTVQTATGTVSVRVNDVNDHVPVFSPKGTVTANVTENSPAGTPLQMNKDITILDVDKDANSDFNLIISNYTNCLEVTPPKARGEATVLIRVSDPKCFDYEIRQTLEFQIIATESTTGNSSSVNINLMILNENDNDPTFNQTTYNGSVPENVKDLVILQVHAFDNDIGMFGSISYSLEGDRVRFTINNKTGEITTKDDNLDRETKDTYLLTVVASDGGGRRSGVPLSITVTDANDETPAFLYSYASRIAEGSEELAPNLTLQANDNDQKDSENSHVIYRIATCIPGVCSNFTLAQNSGLLTVNSPLDYEKLLDVNGVITITVWAIDIGSPQLTGNTTVQITVEDKNDVQPVFSSQTYTANVPENAPSGTSVGQVNASDSDGSAPNNDVFYIISSGSNDQFVIDGNSGNITTVGTLDRERVANYTLIVLAIDRGSPAMTASTTVYIEVLNVNDDPPRFEPPVASVSVDEEINPGSLVYNFIAHDGDSDAALKYSMLWQNSSGFDESQSKVSEVILQSSFKIDSSTGLISVNRRLDRETLESAVLIIMVVDTNAAANTVQTATGTVSVRINDVNDHVPVFSPNGTVTANVIENSPTGTPLQMNNDITILDVDKDANSDFNLSISGFTDCLEVTPPKARREATVLIRVSDPTCFDYESRRTLQFQIVAAMTSRVSITLNILDENDNDPTFNQTSYNGSVVENVKDFLILQVHAIDNDTGVFGSISYSLEGDRDRFTIDSSTGEIRSKDDTLDRETKDTYLLTVVATDGGGRRSGMPLTITVTDANDETPAFAYSYASRIAEGSPDFPSPVTLQAKDNDQQGNENSHVIYRMTTCTPKYCSNFSLDENSGVLSVNSTLDYEKLVDVEGVITIIVQAIDKGRPQLTGNTTVNITVEDKNDVHPVFSKRIYTANVTENAPAGQNVTQVSASDGDGSAPNNVVFYVLESGGSDNFRVNSTSGLITVGPGANLDREKDANYSLTVLTIDRGDPPLSSTTTVSISLVDVNDEPPTFLEQTYEFSIYENASVGDVNLFVTAGDPDTNHDLVYSLLLNESQAFTDRDANVDSSIFRSWFNISPSTGSLRVTSTLDREKAEMVVLKIAVTDRNGLSNLPQTAKTSLRITLRDVNDNKPIITPIGVLNVSEALTTGTEVTTLTAVDLDKDQTVSFFVRDTTSYFQITSDGKVFVNRSLDREINATLEFTVYAKDNGQPSMTSNITVHVNVIDKNDNDPEIANTALIFNVSEGASNGTVFGVISATDKDEGPNALITFGFSDIVNDFSINETTGELSVKRNLDRESLDIYKIGIIALDNPTTDVSRRASKQITINILDINDNSPKFVNFDPNTQFYLGTVAETEPVNSSVTKMNPNVIMATDKDIGENARLSYSIHSLGGADYFIINPSDGVITVNASIVGHAGLYNYTLTVTDHGNVPLTVSANLTIKVVDVNLNKPIFRESAPNIVVAECTPIGTSLYTFIADDADQDKESNGKVIYILGNSTMSPADANHFRLNEDTGLLTSAATFDREIQSSFRISVTARDLGVPSSLETIMSDVEIVLQDENDNPPVFNITRYTFEISESQMSGEVGTVVARDPDNDAKTCYSIISGETVMSSYFNISSNTSNEGVLTLVKTLDREKPEQVTFVFSVTANDCSPSSVACKDIMASKTSSTEVSITVLDVNDNPPNFTQPEYSRGFMTTADFGHVIFNLQELVTDPDTPPNRVHAFYPLGPLEMDQTLKNIESVKNLVEPLILTKNGTVLTNVKFPADAQGLYKWRVMANDSAGNSTTLLKIYIVDEDKLVRITLFQTEDRLRTLQSDIVREISRQTGYDIVADEIKPFIDNNGIVDPSKSNLLIHAVKPDETILDASSLLETMDRLNSLIQTMKNSYQVLSIQTEKVAAAAGDTEGAKIELILAAIIVVLVMAFLITLFLMLNNIRRFKRKLKSATTSAGEMSPIASSPLDRSGIKNNPLYGKEIMNETNVDNTSIASSDSMDKNYVIRPPLENEEQEMKINIYGNEDELPAYKNRQNYLQNVLDGADVENGDPKGFTFNDSELLHTEI